MLYLFLANGFEETEAVTPLDMIRRAELEVKTVGIGGIFVTGSHGITLKADMTDEMLPDTPGDDFEGIVLPGGMPGTLNLDKSPAVDRWLRIAAERGKLVAAICAAPSVPGARGLLRGKRACCFPGFEDRLTGARISNDAVCRDENFITAKGAGAALDFGLAVVEYFCGKERAQLLAAAVCKP